MIVDKFTKSSVIQQTTSEGTPFYQRGGAVNKQLPTYDENIGTICNASDAYKKVTKNHIAQKQLLIRTVIKRDAKKS